MERPIGTDLGLLVEEITDEEVELLAETLSILRRGGDVSVLARHPAARTLSTKIRAFIEGPA